MARAQWLVTAVIIICYLFSLNYFQRWNIVIAGGDPFGYYLYLPATFIHNDLDSLIRTTQARWDNYEPARKVLPGQPLGIGEAHPVGEGKYVSKYPMGVALLTSPFFAVAHLWAINSDQFAADGFSFPYAMVMQLSTLFFTFLGLFVLWKTLRLYYPEGIALITTLVIALATNLFFMTVYISYMAHPYLFALYAILLYTTIRWYRGPSAGGAVLIGLLCGLIALIRPVHVICIFLPLLFGLSDRNSLRERGQLFYRYSREVILAAASMLLMGMLQLVYWKWLTGSWLFYSYVGETFDFSKPEIWRGLFSFRNGWLIYSPVMFLAIAGLYALRRQKDLLWPLAVMLPLHLYITYSWWCWYYINGFGSRPMIDLYALLAFPLAAAIAYFSRRRTSRIGLYLVLGFLIYLNVFQAYQYSTGMLPTHDVRWAYYYRTFLKTRMNYFDLLTYDSALFPPDTNRIKLVEEVYRNDFSDSLSAKNRVDGQRGSRVYQMDQPWEHGPGLYKTVGEMALQPGDWLRLSLDLKKFHPNNNPTNMAMFETYLRRDGKTFHYKGLRLENKVGNPEHAIWGGGHNIWGEAVHWLRLPRRILPSDSLIIEIRNAGGNIFYLDDFSVEVFR